MASETSDRGESMYEADAGAHNQTQDSYFASAHHDHSGDEVFSAGQPENAQNQPVQQVPIAPNDTVIRVQVTPGEVLELSPPFTPDANMVAREANGNLAIKVGDVTVILEGFINANNTAPVVVESSDGKPIDIATVIAQTDPAIDIQTAAGPAAGPQGGQGADNTGAILAQLAGGAGLGGLNAVGAQDGTSLNYKLIDNSIIQDRFLAAGTTIGTTAFGGMHEPFLRDPAHYLDLEPGWNNFNDFKNAYISDLNSLATNTPFPGGWADFKGTEVDPSQTVDDFLAKTTQTITIPHASAAPESLVFNPMDFFAGAVPTSNGQPLDVVQLPGDSSTVFLVRHDANGHDAIVMVFHVEEDATTGDFHVDTYLVNRLDHPDHGDGVTTDSVQDILSIDFHTYTQGSEQEPVPGPTGTVQILDDVPIAHDVTYTSFYGDDNFAPSQDGNDVTTSHSGKHHESFTSTEFGSVDEDWIHGSWWEHNQGNKDQDNGTPGSNSDPAHGDDLGRNYVTGNLDIDFGADGPAGETVGGGGNDCLLFTPGTDTHLALGLENVPDIGQPFKDADGNQMTSDGHTLVVLDHYTDSKGLEHLIVGYNNGEVEKVSDSFFSGEGEGGYGTVKVFELTLDVNPDDHTSSKWSPLQFQDFKFELFHGIDQANNPGGAEPTESNTNLHFNVVGHDDDGDAVHTGINIHVNDDVPMVGTPCYISEKGGTPDISEDAALTFLTGGEGNSGGLYVKSTDYGMVDEDWLPGASGNDVVAGGKGNQDLDGDGNSNAQQNGDDYGKTKVFGALNVHFGGDGPIDNNPIDPTKQALALKVFDTTGGATPLFVDADGHSFTSGGHDLVVLSSSQGHLEVGYQDGEATVHVFTLDLGTQVGSWNFGDFCFTLQGAMDHLDADGKNLPNEQSLPIRFDVTATDADFDTAHASIKIQVNDDKPEIGTTYFNTAPTEGGDEVGSRTSIVAGYTGAGQIDEDWLGNGNHDLDGNGFSNSGQHGDKDGFTSLTGQLDIKWGGDGQSKDPSVFTIGGAENDVVQAKDDNGNTINLQTDDGHDVLLHTETVGGHQILTGYVNDDGSVGFTVGSTTVFTLDLDTGSGAFTFTLDESVKHPIAGTEDNLLLNFGVTAGTDGDGDVATGSIKININDDIPEVRVDYTNTFNDGQPCDADPDVNFGQVDEDMLKNGNHDLDNTNVPGDNDPVRGDDWGGVSVVASLGGTNWGADGEGAGTVTAGLKTFTVGDAFSDAGGTPLTSHDVPLVVLASTADNLTVGYQDGGNDHPVFTLVNNHDGTFTFTLLDAMDEKPGASSEPLENNLYLQFEAFTGATDGDGDPAVAYINIQVNDDAPVAVNDTDPNSTFAGNVLDNDKIGADSIGAKVTVISNGANGDTAVDPNGGDTTIASTLGILTIHADGSWTYQANDNTLGGDDVFTYTLTDGDGDSVKATLTITVEGSFEDSRLASVETGPTHTPGTYDVTQAVTHSTIENPHTSTTYHLTDATGGHTISGGAGNDFIEVTGSKGSILNGGGGDDIIHATAGHNVISGGAGDDTLFGGSGADDFFGGSGHDAMSGGGGDDVFHDVEADDLTGVNTLDGIHTIDGGDGFDTVDLHALKSFDSSQAGRIEHVEALDFSGKASGGGGTTVTLSYDAIYNVTQVGGLQQTLEITGDKSGAGKDSVHLDSTGGHTWSFTGTDGSFDSYSANGAHGTVTVKIETGVHTDLN
jgi:VCBS repeat-containing protein